MSKKVSKDQREMKVYTKYAFSRYGNPSIQPEIRLKGNWVKQWGFNCGDSVSVFRGCGLILIRSNSYPLPKIVL